MWVSSTSPFSRPVWSHWSANWTCERRAINIVITSASGMMTTDTAASGGEIQIIMPSTPADRQHRGEQLRDTSTAVTVQ